MQSNPAGATRRHLEPGESGSFDALRDVLLVGCELLALAAKPAEKQGARNLAYAVRKARQARCEDVRGCAGNTG